DELAHVDREVFLSASQRPRYAAYRPQDVVRIPARVKQRLRPQFPHIIRELLYRRVNGILPKPPLEEGYNGFYLDSLYLWHVSPLTRTGPVDPMFFSGGWLSKERSLVYGERRNLALSALL